MGYPLRFVEETGQQPPIPRIDCLSLTAYSPSASHFGCLFLTNQLDNLSSGVPERGWNGVRAFHFLFALALDLRENNFLRRKFLSSLVLMAAGIALAKARVIFGGMPWFKAPVVLPEPVVPDGAMQPPPLPPTT